MFESLLTVARQVFTLFLLMGVGAACRRFGLLTAQTVKGLTNLLMFVVTPVLIVHVFQRPFEPALLAGLGWALGAAVFTHVAGAALACVVIRDREARRRGVLRFAVMFSNAGFMGLPLEYALLGPRGVFFGAVYVVVFNLLCWSWGVTMMCGKVAQPIGWRTFLLNPGTAGVVLGLPFFVFSWRLPSVVAEPLKMLSDLNTPLAMIMTGWYLAHVELKPVLCCPWAYMAGALRLVAVPLAVVGAFAGLVGCGLRPDPVMCVAICTAAAAPVAALTTVIAARYDRDVSMGAGLVSATTLVSILTMPPVVGLAMHLFLAK